MIEVHALITEIDVSKFLFVKDMRPMPLSEYPEYLAVCSDEAITQLKRCSMKKATDRLLVPLREEMKIEEERLNITLMKVRELNKKR